MDRRKTFKLALAAGALLAAGLGVPAVRAQDTDLGPIARPVTLFLLEQPTVTITFQGDYGRVRATGTLEQAPDEPLRVRSLQGVPREVRWTEVRDLAIVQFPREGMPAGTYQVALVSDPIPLTQVASTGATTDYSSQTGAWGSQRLPEGSLTLSGRPFGRMTIPLSRVTGFQMEPIRGTVEMFPQGEVRMEVLTGSPITVPLQDVQSLQRDQSRDSVTVTLADGQSYTGKLLQLPNVTIPVTTTSGEKVSVPLQRVSYLERTPPGGRLQ